MLPRIKEHIAKRVVRALGCVEPNDSHISAVRRILSVQRNPDDSFVDFHLPLTTRLFDSKVLDAVKLELKPDSIIAKTTDRCRIGVGRVATFTVAKDLFIGDLLSAGLPTDDNRKIDPKNLIVEFSSPNIAKPFHMGHLRSTIVGNFVANAKSLSDNVVRMNYVGDWGTQIGYVRLGIDALDWDDSLIVDDPLRRLYEAYVVANADPDNSAGAKLAFARLERGEPDDVASWSRIRSMTVSHLEATYQKFGIDFDEYCFESSYSSAAIRPHLELLKRNGLLVEDVDGALGVNVDGVIRPILKNDGCSLYLGRDIAAAIDRQQRYKCDKIVYVVDKSQTEHFKCLRGVVQRLAGGELVEHVPFGRVIGMSTRRGTAVFLDDLLETAVGIMAGQQAKSPNTRSTSADTTRILAVSALMVNVLQYKRTRDFHFDWDNALRSTGDTGVKLQYTHSRLSSLEANCGTSLPDEINPECVAEPIAIQLAVEIARFEEVLTLAQDQLESSVLVNYLFRLCNVVSQCLKSLPIKGRPTDIGRQRLALFNRARIVVNRAMKLLGLQPLRCM